ncbi:MAG: DUF362 domain-containing protein [Bacteroidetes bacterium]|nr:DUF362 domain-containing protein [Bacteroidota bacterium]MCL5025175.1 DUF362 domain-containing protein [Chloroflexota bacterium]
MEGKSRVALVKGDNRYDNIRKALALVDEDIDLRGKQRVVVKVNFVSASRQLAATHVDAVRSVLDFVRERYRGKLAVVEAAELGTTMDGYRKFGYLDLPKRYDVELIDLYGDEGVDCRAFDRDLQPINLKVSRYLVESDYRISVGPPKTHESTVVTLSAKNMVVGSLIKNAQGNERKRFHQGYQAINLNMYRIVQLVYPHLAVIDGFEGMDGHGPTGGDPVDLRAAIASTDFVAADTVGAMVMGQDPSAVGWLSYCHKGGLGQGDLSRIQVLGNSIAECAVPFRRHPDYDKESHWQVENVERYL